MVAHILPITPPPPSTLGVGSKGQYSTFPEHGHIAYQIKGTDECSILQASILSLHIPSTSWVGAKINTFFLRVVILHIKLHVMEMEHRAPGKHTFCLYTYSRTLGWGQRFKTFLLRVVMFYIT